MQGVTLAMHTGLTAVDNEAFKDADQAATDQPERLHFAAATPHGPVHLELPARHCSDAIGAALALADAEPLLSALESWLGLDLDPSPEPCPNVPQPGLVWCTAPNEARLGLPWPLLAQAPPCGMPLLHGPDWELQVVLARWPALPTPPTPPDRAAAGLLLLPASFDSPWCVRLLQAALGLEIDAHWAGPGHAPQLASAPRPSQPANAAMASVRLLQTLRWPMAAVLGWSPSPETPLSDRALAFGAGAAAASHHGSIVPALAGFGLMVPAEA